ncbi:hypothetical protein [Tsuneonella mangrovi]|uniref:hypothetical protein n=1 Tax=Tsuneonella mangrovi TaxID=1982042 RepID=UPI000BA21FE3|nr:hypothetical protein [Tsuneonella mangrovi]
MEIHKPKPFHNWREFLKEYGIIVLGVLTALALEQAVESWHWRHEVEVAEASMEHELLWDDEPQIYQRAVIHPCVVGALDSIRTAVEARKSREDIARLIDRYWVPIRTYDQLALDSANASDVSSHMSPGRFDRFRAAYLSMPIMQKNNFEEAVDGARLRAFRRIGGPISDAEADRLLGAIEALRSEDALMFQSAQINFGYLKAIGKPDADRVKMFMSDARSHYGSCVQDLPADWPAGPSRLDC